MRAPGAAARARYIFVSLATVPTGARWQVFLLERGKREVTGALSRLGQMIEPFDGLVEEADRRRARALITIPLFLGCLVGLGSILAFVMATLRLGLGPIDPILPNPDAPISWWQVLITFSFSALLLLSARVCRTAHYRVGAWATVLLIDIFVVAQTFEGQADAVVVMGFMVPILVTTVILEVRTVVIHSVVAFVVAVALLIFQRVPASQLGAAIGIFAGIVALTTIVATLRENDIATLTRLRRLERSEADRIQQELTLARRVQLAMLPQELPALDGVDVAAFSEPAFEASGDFYDVFLLESGELEDDLLGVTVCDVAGKGVASALVMSATRASLRSAAARLRSPAAVLCEVNETLVSSIPPDLFVTACYAVVNPSAGTIVHASAGHPHPLRWTAADVGAAEVIGFGVPLGLVSGADYTDVCTDFKEGDVIGIYSDGVAEAMNPNRSMYGFERTLEDFEAEVRRGGSLQDRLDRVLGRLQSFADGEPYDDDVTMVMIQRTALAESNSRFTVEQSRADGAVGAAATLLALQPQTAEDQ